MSASRTHSIAVVAWTDGTLLAEVAKDAADVQLPHRFHVVRATPSATGGSVRTAVPDDGGERSAHWGLDGIIQVSRGRTYADARRRFNLLAAV